MKKLLISSFVILSLTACNQQQTPAQTQTSETPSTTTTEQTQPASDIQYTMDEVAKHADQSSCWTVVDGKVYDLTDWISKHPGGAGNILKICGIDATEAFAKQHGSSANAQNALQQFYISDLQN